MLKLLAMRPIISVIIPTYNRLPLLERAVDSVLGQDFKDFELIVVDDGSTDGTAEWLAEASKKLGFSYLSRPNQGVSSARNLGVQHSKGEWLAFLDSDDEWLPEKLSKQFKFSQENPDIPLIHGDEIWIRNGVRVNPMKKHQKKGGDVFADAVKLCCISPSTVMLKRQLFDEFEGFREDFEVCEDYDLWLKISSKYSVGYIEEFLIKKYGGHQDQLSRKYFAMDYWRVESLSNILQTPLIESKRALAKKELIKKADVLLKGYRKHSNLRQYDRVFEILKKQI